jgi:hypothetical protein
MGPIHVFLVCDVSGFSLAAHVERLAVLEAAVTLPAPQIDAYPLAAGTAPMSAPDETGLGNLIENGVNRLNKASSRK